MRIIALKTIREFWKSARHKDSEQALKSWYSIARNADCAGPHDIKEQFAHASIIGNRRIRRLSDGYQADQNKS